MCERESLHVYGLYACEWECVCLYGVPVLWSIQKDNFVQTVYTDVSNLTHVMSYTNLTVSLTKGKFRATKNNEFTRNDILQDGRQIEEATFAYVSVEMKPYCNFLVCLF